MADKRGEMAEKYAAERCHEDSTVARGMMTEAFLAGFDAGASLMRERVESVFASEIEDVTNAEFRLESDRLTVRAWLMNARARIRSLPLDPKETQDAE